MGSWLAYTLLASEETKPFFQIEKLAISLCNVNNNFVIFKQKSDIDDFLFTLSCLYSAQAFTFDKKHDGRLQATDRGWRTWTYFETIVYQTLTFSGQDNHWIPSSLQKRKTNLITMLVHKTLLIRAIWIGRAYQQLRHQINPVVKHYNRAVSPCLIFPSQCMLPGAKKHALSANQQSMM